MSSLSQRDARMLEFEQRYSTRAGGAKEEAITQEFGLSPARYYQRLNKLVELPAAYEAYPSLVARLRRLRERRSSRRFLDHSDRRKP